MNFFLEKSQSLFLLVFRFRVGSNELMGGCALGPPFVGTGRDHWYEMLENTRKPVAQWYSLLEQVPGGQEGHQLTNGK